MNETAKKSSNNKSSMTAADWLWVEKRAAALGEDAPRGLFEGPYTSEERRGWSIHYWDAAYGTVEDRARVPENRRQWAGWLARVIFLTRGK